MRQVPRLTITPFNGDSTYKANVLRTIQSHIAAETLVQNESYSNGRGSILDILLNGPQSKKVYALFEEEYKFPAWTGRVLENLFDNLPLERARMFAFEFFLKTSHQQPLDWLGMRIAEWSILHAFPRFSQQDSAVWKHLEVALTLYHRELTGAWVSPTEWETLLAGIPRTFRKVSTAEDIHENWVLQGAYLLAAIPKGTDGITAYDLIQHLLEGEATSYENMAEVVLGSLVTQGLANRNLALNS